MPFPTSDTWPRIQPPSYRVQPPTPARPSPGPGPAPRRRTGWGESTAASSPLMSPGMSTTASGASTPRRGHAHKMSTSSSAHSLRPSSSNSSLRGMSRSGSHTSLPFVAGGFGPPGIPRSRSANQHLTYAHHLPSPVTETMEVVDPAELRPSPPSSHLASSPGSADDPDALSDEYESEDPDRDLSLETAAEPFEPPCQFFGYPASETLYAPSACGCCTPVHTHAHVSHSHSHTPAHGHGHLPGTGYDLMLAPEHALAYPPGHPYYANAQQHPSHSPPSPSGKLTGLANRLFYTYIAPHLPEDIQAIIADPPDLRRPESLVPLLRAIAPYAQYLIFLVALYIVYAFVTGMVWYTARFIRFCFRITPVIGIIAWIMAASGQGGIEVVYEALKAYAGLTPTDGGAAGRARARGATGRQHYAQGGYHGNPRTRARARKAQQQQQAQPDILSAIFGNPATGDEGLASTVQDYVRAAVARGLGLEWLVGNKKDEGKKTKSR